MSKAPLTFRIFHGGKLVREETLSLAVIKLGKVPSAHLRLDDDSVSRMHAILEVEPSGAIQLIDLGSTRGTFVNGAKINKARVADGDIITLGDTRIELAVGAAQAEIAPPPVTTWAPPPPVAVAAPLPPPIPVAAAAIPQPALAPLPMLPTPDDTGARAVEVAAMLGDSVVEVKHCMDPRGGKVTRATYALLGASALCLATAAASFVTSVHVASRNADGLAYWTHALHKPAHAFRPEHTSGALDLGEVFGLALGLGTAAAGLSRARRERKSPFFRIGTAPGVECATESAPSPSFPLVAPSASGDDFVFHFAPGIDGEMIANGTTTPLAELAASGRARPSATQAGAFELPIPPAARIRARAGATTFLVSGVYKPRAQATAGFALDPRAASYVAASLVVHLGLWGLANLGSADAAGISLDTTIDEGTAIRANLTAMETPPPPPDPTTGDSGQSSDAGGGKMQLEEGAAGKPDSTNPSGHMEIKDNQQAQVQIARADAIAYARSAGVLGDTMALEEAITSVAGTYDISNGFDNANVYGPLFGAAGEGHGNFGMGRNGWGGGGGCVDGDCGGVGAGAYHTIGNGSRAGTGWSIGTGHGPGGPGHTPLVPTVKIPAPTAVGDLDRSIIKRYVNREHEKIAFCYSKELLAHPNLSGDVSVQFFIAPDGSVRSSVGAGFNNEVASCVADVVHAIAFPAPKDGGGVQVNYPFHFRMAAAQQ